ncbi:MAG: hypothetical protein HKM07_00370 [Chlamydiae bacterium]|nr:hypothetical protein [Chlamydiota bacterium]
MTTARKAFKCLILFLTFCISFSVFSYEGEEEVERVFSKIKDLRSPTLEEYKQIQEFLRYGKREYLAPFYLPIKGENKTGIGRARRVIQLVSDQDEMPVFEINRLVANKQNKNCILLYSSYDPMYAKRIDVLRTELRQKGFQGDILIRKGGYPYMNKEGIKLCHIPYSWKVAFFKEAIELGYKNILWIDLSLYPLKNLQEIFTLLEQKGHLCLSGGVNLDFGYKYGHHLDGAIHSLKISNAHLAQIPHITTTIVGFNADNPKSMKVISEWFEETKRVEPCMTLYPEELALSVVAWRNGLTPLMKHGLIVCVKENYHQRRHYPLWNFLQDLQFKFNQ